MEKRYTCEEISRVYGVKVTTVWSWIRNKKLTAIRTGKQYVVRKEDLERFERERITII